LEEYVMKKGLSALLFALTTIALLASTALAAPAQSNRNATLTRVTYEKGGIVLLFHASGLSRSDLNNTSFTAHDKQWKMTCRLVDQATQIRCVMPKKLSMFAGEGFHGSLAGFYFSGEIPGVREFPNPAVSSGPSILSDIPATCSDGQTMYYTFEYSSMAYQAEVWSDYFMDPGTFHSLYNFFPENTSTYTENYSLNGVDYTRIYYIYGYTTFTSGHGTTPSTNWEALVTAYESDGFTIQKTGESCDDNV